MSTKITIGQLAVVVVAAAAVDELGMLPPAAHYQQPEERRSEPTPAAVTAHHQRAVVVDFAGLKMERFYLGSQMLLARNRHQQAQHSLAAAAADSCIVDADLAVVQQLYEEAIVGSYSASFRHSWAVRHRPYVVAFVVEIVLDAAVRHTFLAVVHRKRLVVAALPDDIRLVAAASSFVADAVAVENWQDVLEDTCCRKHLVALRPDGTGDYRNVEAPWLDVDKDRSTDRAVAYHTSKLPGASLVSSSPQDVVRTFSIRLRKKSPARRGLSILRLD